MPPFSISKHLNTPLKLINKHLLLVNILLPLNTPPSLINQQQLTSPLLLNILLPLNTPLPLINQLTILLQLSTPPLPLINQQQLTTPLQLTTLPPLTPLNKAIQERKPCLSIFNKLTASLFLSQLVKRSFLFDYQPNSNYVYLKREHILD